MEETRLYVREDSPRGYGVQIVGDVVHHLFAFGIGEALKFFVLFSLQWKRTMENNCETQRKSIELRSVSQNELARVLLSRLARK